MFRFVSAALASALEVGAARWAEMEIVTMRPALFCMNAENPFAVHFRFIWRVRVDGTIAKRSERQLLTRPPKSGGRPARKCLGTVYDVE